MFEQFQKPAPAVFARTYFLQGLDQGFLFILRQKRGNVSAVPSPKPITILAHLFFGLIIRQNLKPASHGGTF